MAVIEKIKELFSPDTDGVVFENSTPQSISFEIQPLTVKQLDQLIILSLRCFEDGEHYSRLIFEHLLTAPDYLSYQVVSDTNKMVGYILISLVNETVGHITTICTAPEYRNRGLAAKLIRHSEGAIKKRGADSVVLEVRESNYKAQNLYHKLGFIIIQKMPSYYTNGDNAYLMSKSL